MISDWFYSISNWRRFQIDLLGRKFWCRLTAPMLIGGGITGGKRIMHMMVIDEMGCHDKMKKIFFDQKGRMIIWLDDKEGRWIKTSEEGNWKFKGRRQSSGDHLWLQRCLWWGLGGTQSQGKQGKRLKGFKWALPVWGRFACVSKRLPGWFVALDFRPKKCPFWRALRLARLLCGTFFQKKIPALFSAFRPWGTRWTILSTAGVPSSDILFLIFQKKSL